MKARTRERFQEIRSRHDPLSLRLRLVLLVSAELLAAVLIALALYFWLRDLIPLSEGTFLLIDLGLISLFVGVLVTGFLSKLFFDPIKRLRDAMAAVADGDFSARLPELSSSKEILEMYSGFNMMAQELEATEILQTDFVSNVSHEIKTPISAIEGYSTLLQNDENLTDEQQAYVQKILFNTGRLSDLVGSILLLSKLENRQIPTNRTAFRLDEQIRQSIVALEPAWERRNTQFDVELERITCTANEPMLRHVWDNLISNAIKFGPLGGTVRIRLTKQAHTICFTVDDEGPGLSNEARKHIFDKFYQADSSHKQEGNGLGLALVKRITALEGGSVFAENLPAGCRFTVFLPDK